jgi:hypothetical protein
MNSELESFLSARLPFAGLVAWGARYPDRTLAQQCFSTRLTPVHVEQAMIQLTAAADNLAGQDLQPIRLYWTFERLRVCLATRRDGAALALLVENRAELRAASEKAIEDFLDLAAWEGV